MHSQDGLKERNDVEEGVHCVVTEVFVLLITLISK